jgi:hypothetical protein
MKTYLVFLKNGEIIENKIKTKLFNIGDFNYKLYKQYDNFLILYNEICNDDEDRNITSFYFTNDKFKNDIVLLRVDENLCILNFKITDYIKNLKISTKIDESSVEYDQNFKNDEIEFLLKEPFDY